MNTRIKTILAVFLAVTLTSLVTIRAHNGSFRIDSTGTTAAAPALGGGGTAWVGEWAGASPETTMDYLTGGPLVGHVWALHKDDGIYLLIKIDDAAFHSNDTLVILFDLNHSGGAVDSSDFGFEVRRGGTAKFGPVTVPRASWDPTTNAVVSDAALSTWTVEAHLPTTSPLCSPSCDWDLSANAGKIGIYFQIFDASIFSTTNSAIYTQWPAPPDVEQLSDGTPQDWGNYEFDPASTFPDLSVTDVHRGDTGLMSDYSTISHSANNRFDVVVNVAAGALVPNAANVRFNLYLAAIGIGEPWHRLDRADVIDADCAQPDALWPPLPLPTPAKSSVCNLTTHLSLPDIGNPVVSDTDIVHNLAAYTIKDGVDRIPTTGPVNPTATVPPGVSTVQVLTWDTNAAQDPRFGVMTDGTTTVNRVHQCLMAEALYPNDPNPSNNRDQRNMNFAALVGGGGGGGGGGAGAAAKAAGGANEAGFAWGIGNAGFGKYDPAVGKDMFLQVDMKNMDRRAGWDFRLDGVKPGDRENVFVAHLVGKESQQARLVLKAPPAETLGHTLKENQIVPPKAGGFQVNAKIPSGDAPVYVKVTAGTTLQIVNYPFSANDEQNVDLDGNQKLFPPNGPGGLPASALQAAIQKLGDKYRLLLTPNAPLGALVGSWDNFQTAFLIGNGVQVRVPANANFLALGINDGLGFYGDNAGTGFRVKVAERIADASPPVAPAGTPAGTPARTSGTAKAAVESQSGAAARNVIPISEVMPVLCINGYEDIGQKRNLGGTPHELFRFVGKVCWTVVNVYPPNRSDEPDQGDAFDGAKVIPKPKGCGSGRKGSFTFASLITLLGIFAIRRRTSGKAKTT